MIISKYNMDIGPDVNLLVNRRPSKQGAVQQKSEDEDSISNAELLNRRQHLRHRAESNDFHPFCERTSVLSGVDHKGAGWFQIGVGMASLHFIHNKEEMQG